MGGYGSGSWYRFSKKPTEDNFWQFTITTLQKHKLLIDHKHCFGSWKWSHRGEEKCSIGYELNTRENLKCMRVYYTNTRTTKKYDYKIYLTTTTPNFGGKRWWFECPVQGCSNRVSVLYLSDILACRKCCNIAYESQNEAPHYRMLSKAQKLHAQLGGNGWLEIPPRKPKGMHWKTYEKKINLINANSDLSDFIADAFFKNHFNKLDAASARKAK